MLFNVSLGPAGGEVADMLCGDGAMPSLSQWDNISIENPLSTTNIRP